VILPQESVEAIWQAIEATPSTEITVDLDTRTVSYNDVTVAFELDDYTRWRLMEGLDDIGITLSHSDSIGTFEQARPSWKPSVSA
jgi:3-isopropylmalate/(R)-2-methylmalate dehydratase small subunit